MAEFANTELSDATPGRIGSDATPTMTTPLTVLATPEGVAVTAATAATVNMATHEVLRH
ncbi:linaridin family RiPP [Streptomyces sp. YGL11-2]|uniref:linaridin family RiPP n=1 Tax=Streptomyces sp. YGL11-2 TaxID=3414028 RepID=UPI003CFB8504